MSAPKFASLTPDLLARKGEAAPSIVAPPIVGFFPERPRVATAGALRMQRAGSLPTLVIGDAFPAMQTDDAEASIPQPPAKAKKASGRTVTLPADDSETIALIAVKKSTPRHELLRLARETGGEILIPIDVAPNADGTVLLSLFDAPETFSYHGATGNWIGAEGSSFKGEADAFDDVTGWSITLAFSDSRALPSIGLCHNGDYEELRIGP